MNSIILGLGLETQLQSSFHPNMLSNTIRKRNVKWQALKDNVSEFV